MRVEFAREQMIMQQIRAGEVLEQRVLDAMARVPREQFVPDAYRGLAFADFSIPLPESQCMMSPLTEGLLLQALDLAASDRVLEVGTGSGYLAACLAALAHSVISIEIFPSLSQMAAGNLETTRVRNVSLQVADVLSLPRTTEFDAIAVTGSMPLYDSRFEHWLCPGGRMFVITGSAPVMTAMKVTRIGDNEWTREKLFETVIPPLINMSKPNSFAF